jgi:hypothetical protein
VAHALVPRSRLAAALPTGRAGRARGLPHPARRPGGRPDRHRRHRRRHVVRRRVARRAAPR